MKRLLKKYPLNPTVIGLIALFVFSLFIFYRTPLRSLVHNQIKYFQIRLFSGWDPPLPVTVVMIDEDDIKTLDPGKKDLSFESLRKIVQHGLDQGALTVVPYLHAQVFSHESDEYEGFLQWAKDEERLKVCVFDHDVSFHEMALSGTDNPQILDGEIYYPEDRSWRTNLYRSPIIQTNIKKIPHFISIMADKIQPGSIEKWHRSNGGILPAEDGFLYMDLNFLEDLNFHVVDVGDFLASDQFEYFKNRHIVIAYRAFRGQETGSYHATKLNTPLQNPDGELDQGVPMVFFHLNGVSNIVHESGIRNAPLILLVFITIIFTLLSYYLWTFGMTLPTVLYGVALSVLFIVLAQMRAYYSWELSLADALFFSTWANVFGAVIKVGGETKAQLRQAEAQKTQTEMAGMQGQFLSDFSIELGKLNNAIGLSFESFKTQLSDGGRGALIYANAIESQRDFKGYLDNIAQFSKLSSFEKAKMRKNKYEVLSLLKTTTKRLSGEISAKKQTVKIQCDSALDVRCDKGLLLQILHNIVSNASKYSPDESVIHISAKKDGHECNISISDEGAGIAPEFREKVFERFYRIKNDNVYRIKGTGLGLYLTKYFTELQDGRVNVEASESGGSQFNVWLPY